MRGRAGVKAINFRYGNILDRRHLAVRDFMNDCFRANKLQSRLTGVGVRREKAALFQWVQIPPGEIAPAGSNRSSHGGNEVAEAFDATDH